MTTVRLLFSNFPDEVITPRLECEGAAAREIESALLETLVGREFFGDDTPISPTFDMQWDTWVSPFGIAPKLTHAKSNGGKGFHIDPVIEDLEADMEKLRGGSFGADKEKTAARISLAQEIFGDILPVRLVQRSLTGAITNPLVHLMGMENYYFSMYDTPEALHEVMAPGLMFTIEPMVNMGSEEIYVDDSDGWTVYTEDGLPSAQWEIQVLVTEDGYEIIAY